jgi:transposase
MYYVGIDWADTKYDIMILDHSGRAVLKPFIIEKNQDDFLKLLQRLRKLSDDPQTVKIGIETQHNLLVDFLVNFNYPVFCIFTGSMKSFRARYRVSRARDDVFDAYVLADVLRTDKACWKKVDFGSETVREIKILVADHYQLVNQRATLQHIFVATLKAYYPEYIHFFANVSCASSLAFIQAFPDFESAKKLSSDELTQFFKEHRYRNSEQIENIFTRLHQERIMVPPPVERTKMLKAIALVKLLLQFSNEIKSYQSHIHALLQSHPDSEIFMSYPGVAEILAARLLALFGDNRDRFPDVSEPQE